jgi:hypothetical protein
MDVGFCDIVQAMDVSRSWVRSFMKDVERIPYSKDPRLANTTLWSLYDVKRRIFENLRCFRYTVPTFFKDGASDKVDMFAYDTRNYTQRFRPVFAEVVPPDWVVKDLKRFGFKRGEEFPYERMNRRFDPSEVGYRALYAHGAVCVNIKGITYYAKDPLEDRKPDPDEEGPVAVPLDCYKRMYRKWMVMDDDEFMRESAARDRAAYEYRCKGRKPYFL